MAKILIFHHYNSSLGAGLSLLHILRAIPPASYDVTVCLPEIPGDLDTKIKEMGIKVIYCNDIPAYMHFSGSPIPFVSRRHFNNIRAIKSQIPIIEEIIVNENPDIVAVNSMTLFWIGKIAKSKGKKALCFHRETYKHGLLGVRSNYIKTHLSTDFDAVAFLSYFDINETPKGTAQYFRITDKVDVDSYLALDQTGCRKELGLPDSDIPLILYAGGMAKLKGPEVLIKAIGKMKNTQAKIVFLQYTPQNISGLKAHIKNTIKILTGKNLQYKIEKYIEKHKLADRIIFHPSTDCVEKYFVACNAVVFPCYNAHQARPAYEAGVAKKPLVITDFPNYAEFLDDTNCWKFPKNDYTCLAHCLDAVVSDNTIEKTEENYRRVMQYNNLNTHTTEICEILRKLDKE